MLGRTFFLADINVAADLVELLAVDDGADVGFFVKRIPHLKGIDLFNQLLNKRIMKFFMNKNARLCPATLPLTGKAHTTNGTGNCLIKVGIVHHDHW